jgi:molybdopterin-containing oxidoreductase family iron-sulfur binding subunit
MPKKKEVFTRREFVVKAVGALGLLAVSSTVFANLNRVLADTPGDKTKPLVTPSVVKGNTRAWSMIIDLKKCDGCVGLNLPPQCTQACIAGMFAPKGQHWIEVFKQELPGGSYFMPTPCYHCENAPCVNVCPVGATYHRPDGIVLIDDHRCIGCRMCMSACPYQRRFFNWGTPQLPPEATAMHNTPEYAVPAIKGTVIKCDFCPSHLDVGLLPFCVTGCPRKVLYMGDLDKDVASNGVGVVKLSRFLADNGAYRYKEYLGTQPRVWYLPGHGQEFGRKADDPRLLKPSVWSWGGEGYDRRVDVYPWKESVPWTWEEH